MADWETVRAIALGLPEAEEIAGSRPAFHLGGKLFAWIARERDGGGLAVRGDREEKHLLLESNPQVYFSSPTTSATRASRSGSSSSTRRS